VPSDSLNRQTRAASVRQRLTDGSEGVSPAVGQVELYGGILPFDLPPETGPGVMLDLG